MPAPPKLPARLTGGGFTLGRIAGIRIVLAPSWVLAAILITFVYSGVAQDALGVGTLASIALGFGFAVLLATSVLLHELGHCAIASLLGIPVRRIVLFLLGGVSEVERDPDRPRDEYLVAIAGPLVSLFLAGAGALALTYGDPGRIGGELLFQVTAANAVVAVFNLLPGLPLDGGRLLRAGIWQLTGNHLTGTTAAAIGGRVVAVAVVVLACWLYAAEDAVTLASVAVSIVLAAMMWATSGAALHQARAAARAETLTLADLVRPTGVVSADLPVSEALRRLETEELSALVIADSAGTPTGLLQVDRARAVPPTNRPWATVGEIAHAVKEDQVVRDSLSGTELLSVVRAHPSPEYLVTSRDGTPVGVLLAQDLVSALTQRTPPAGRRTGR